MSPKSLKKHDLLKSPHVLRCRLLPECRQLPNRLESEPFMQGKRANRKPEPVAVPIYGDMRLYLEMQPRSSEYLFARGFVTD